MSAGSTLHRLWLIQSWMYYLVRDNKGRGVTRRAMSPNVPHSQATFQWTPTSGPEGVRRPLTRTFHLKQDDWRNLLGFFRPKSHTIVCRLLHIFLDRIQADIAGLRQFSSINEREVHLLAPCNKISRNINKKLTNINKIETIFSWLRYLSHIH